MAHDLAEGIPAAEVKKKWEGGEKLTVGEMLRMRVRYFTDGLVIGGREFVEEYFEQNRSAFGSRRKSGARKVRGWDLRDTESESSGVSWLVSWAMAFGDRVGKR